MTRSYFAELLITHLNRMRKHSALNNSTFALCALPFDQLHWGTGPKVGEGSGKYLCVKTKAVTVWLVGEVKGFRTKDFQFKPYVYNTKRVVVGVVTFLAHDRTIVKSLLGTYAMPAITLGRYDTLHRRVY